MPQQSSIGVRRAVPSAVLFGLVGACAVLTVLCACLISTIILIQEHRDNVMRLNELDTVRSHEQFGRIALLKLLKYLASLRKCSARVAVMNGCKVSEYMMKPLEPWEENVRLPSGVTPTHYRLYLHPDLEEGTFSGNVDINVNITVPSTFLAVHIKALNITQSRLIHNGREIAISDSFFSPRNSFWVLRLPDDSPLPVGSAVVSFVFSGSLTKSIVGFYRSTYTDPASGKIRKIATSKFEPVDARAAFPCFDEPALKATFAISLVRPADGYSALSNMDLKSEEAGPGANEVTVHFQTSVPMSTYLVCFIVSDFLGSPQEVIPNFGASLPIQVLATPQQVKNTGLALSVAKQVTSFYLTYFKIAYPLPKLDLIAIPDFVSGAMEHWGLITFRETALLFDAATNGASAQKRVASVVAHEIAHQWFGNLVTMAWWDDLWLNEGFASFMESKALANGVEECRDWQLLSQVIYDDMQPVLKVDAALNSHPIVQAVDNPDQINQLFDSVSYDKGQAVLRMLEDFIGADTFAKGLVAYLAANQFKNARTEDLWTSLDQAMGGKETVPDVMATWTRQMGYPVVQVVRSSDSIKLTQQRYLADKDATFNASDSPFGYKWDIPIRYTTSENTVPTLLWLNRDTEELSLPISSRVTYVKLNSNQVGFYRVNYEPADWKVLTSNIMKLEVLDRAHLLDDVFSLAGSGHTDYALALDMANYLKNEKEYLPWATGTTVLRELGLLLAGTKAYPDYRLFVQNLVSGLYGTGTGQYSWADPGDDTHLNRLLRVKILSAACSAGIPKCLTDVGALFNTWLLNNETPITPDLRPLVYFYGMKAVGKVAEWDNLWAIYLKETNAQERIYMLEALANAQEPWLIQRFLEYAWIETNVRSQDYFSVLAYVAKNPIGAPILWDFFRSKWPELVNRFGLQSRNLGNSISSITSTFCTQLRLDELRAFYAKYPEAGAGVAARKNSEEKIATRIKWVNRNAEVIHQWLSSAL